MIFVYGVRIAVVFLHPGYAVQAVAVANFPSKSVCNISAKSSADA